MSEILDLLFSDEEITTAALRKKIKSGYAKIPLFEELSALKGKTLFYHLNKYKKLRRWTLEDLIEADVIDLDEQNDEGQTLVQLLIANNDVEQVKILLCRGARLQNDDLILAEKKAIKSFLTYRPGKDEVSILEFCSKRHRDDDYLEYIEALIFDEADTTDNSSSDAEIMSDEGLSDDEQAELDDFRTKKLKKYNKNPKKYLDDDQLCLVAARGIHFSPKYFEEKTMKKVKIIADDIQSIYII